MIPISAAPFVKSIISENHDIPELCQTKTRNFKLTEYEVAKKTQCTCPYSKKMPVSRQKKPIPFQSYIGTDINPTDLQLGDLDKS